MSKPFNAIIARPENPPILRLKPTQIAKKTPDQPHCLNAASVSRLIRKTWNTTKTASVI